MNNQIIWRPTLFVACLLVLGIGDPVQASEWKESVVVYHEEGRFAGWPANNGCWAYGEEIVVGFMQAWYQDKEGGHSYNENKPSHTVLARSHDGGMTWTTEVHDELRVDEDQKVSYLREPIDFSKPGFALRCGKHYFHCSYDKGKTWGPIIHLRDDGRKWDLGYCRTVVRPDDRLVTIYYYTTQKRPEMHIAATIWDADRVGK